MRMLPWNCRGLGGLHVQLAVLNYLIAYSIDIVSLFRVKQRLLIKVMKLGGLPGVLRANFSILCSTLSD